MSLKIYACGGAGVNICKHLPDTSSVVFVDTSKSNLNSVRGSKNVFLVEGMDGAGKHRRSTGDQFSPISSDVIISHKPDEVLNVVISSLSGGSGSVIAPSLTYELLKQGKNVVVIGVYTANSFREMENSINTLKSYRGVADRSEKPVCMFYINSEQRSEADKQALWFMDILRIITDREITEEFDTGDITNFFNYTRVTDNQPSLAFIETNSVDEVQMTPKGVGVVSTIHISRDPQSHLLAPIPEYQAKCLVTDPGTDFEDCRIDALSGVAAGELNRLISDYNELKEQKEVNRVTDIEVDEGASDKGIVY